jgi:NDP-sugar pyrophosphorylase family protein
MIKEYITLPTVFPLQAVEPWKVVENLCKMMHHLIATLGDGYEVKDGVAIHPSAVIGHNVTIKAPAIISANCFVGSNSYLRGGVFMAPGAKVGISCEVKTSVLLENCAITHFTFVGDSIIGHNVNIEAGAILCNHYNEREDDIVYVHVDGQRVSTGLHKFGSLVGDGCRWCQRCALAWYSSAPRTIVRRLELIEQDSL